MFATLIGKGALGQKTGAGFYRREGKTVLRFDPAKGDYVPAGGKADETVARILKKKDPAERLKLLRESTNPQAQFVWSILRDAWHYAACKLEEIADNARDVDLAMRFGFAASQGPFEAWQQAGWTQVAQWIRDDIDAGKAIAKVPLPAWVFDGPVAERGGVHQPEGSWSPARARVRRALDASGLPAPDLSGRAGRREGADRTHRRQDGVRGRVDPPVDAEAHGLDDVLIASIRTKVHAIGPGVIAGLLKAVELAEREYRGLVIWSPDDPFSYGADLQAMLPVFMSGGAAAIGEAEKALQDAMLRLRYAQVPTVAAIANMALGGGCELAAYCARRVAHLESYIGLVEVGVGLIPGGGGLAYGARRAAELNADAPDAYLLDYLKKYFMAAATAQVSRSAIEAQAIGYLLESDTIVFNRHELLYVALREAKAMSETGWRPPRKSGFRVAGTRGRRHDFGAADQHARRRIDLGARLPPRQDHRGNHVRRRRRCGRDRRRGVDHGARAQGLHQPAHPPQDAGTDHGDDADRQAGAQLNRQARRDEDEQASSGRVHRRCEPHADRQGAQGDAAQRAAGRPPRARDPQCARAGARAGSGDRSRTRSSAARYRRPSRG